MVSKFADDVDLEEYEPVPTLPESEEIPVQDEKKLRVSTRSRKKDEFISDSESGSVEEIKQGELDLGDFLGEAENSVEISHATHDGYDAL